VCEAGFCRSVNLVGLLLRSKVERNFDGFPDRQVSTKAAEKAQGETLTFVRKF